MSLFPGRTRDTVPAVEEIVPANRVIWLNGELVPWAQATVHVLSHSLQRGSLVFDYMAVHETPRGSAIFRLDRHVQRMLRSCELMGLPIALDEAELSSAIVQAVRANPGGSSVKASAYFASLEVDVVPVDTRVSVAIAVYDPKTDLGERLQQARPQALPQALPRAERRPLRLWLEKQAHQRRDDIVSPHAKVSANYASSMTAKARAQKLGFDEILLVDENDHVAEGPTTNVFVVDRDGVLLTPPETRVLRGVTRESIIELARIGGTEVREQSIEPAELMAASEVFLTGTTAGVLAVESVDGESIGSACPGPLSQKLAEILSQVESGNDSRFDHWLTYVGKED